MTDTLHEVLDTDLDILRDENMAYVNFSVLDFN